MEASDAKGWVVIAIEHLGPGVSLVPERWRSGSSGARLFGREAETAMLEQLVARIPERGAALVLRGDPGIGKTALLAAASTAASSKGVSVLRTAGAQSETGLGFAGLHQLLRPVLGAQSQSQPPFSVARFQSSSSSLARASTPRQPFLLKALPLPKAST